MVTGNIYVHLRKKTFKKIYSPKKTLVNTGEAPVILHKGIRKRHSLSPHPPRGLKACCFNKVCGEGENPKNESRCRISSHFAPPDLSKNLRELKNPLKNPPLFLLFSGCT